MAKNSYNNSNILKPVNKETARAMGWLEGDHEIKRNVVVVKPPTKINYPEELIICPKCNAKVMAKNLKKHYLIPHII